MVVRAKDEPVRVNVAYILRVMVVVWNQNFTIVFTNDAKNFPEDLVIEVGIVWLFVV